MSVLIRAVPLLEGVPPLEGPSPGGGWRASVSRWDQSPVEAVVSAALTDEVERLAAELSAAADRGDDGALSKLEEELGQALATALHATPGLARASGQLLGAVRHGDLRLPVVVDASPPLDLLPWELLADLPDGDPLEGADLGWVVRRERSLTPYRLPATASVGLRQLRWTFGAPTGEVARHLQALDGVALSLSPIRALDLSGPAPAEPGWADVLHLVIDARELEEGLAQALRALGGEGGPLRGARLVVLDVCGAAGRWLGAQALGARLVQAGAVACIHPRRGVSADAARAFASGLYDALVAGCSPEEAAVAGRRRLRALQGGRGAARWSDLALSVASARHPEEPPLIHGNTWIPRGWPHPHADTAALLRAARALAEDHGFVGIEHLALAMDDRPAPGPWSARVQALVRRRGRDLLRPLDRLKARLPGGAADWRGTPRLAALGARLHPGFSVEALWRVVAAELASPLHLIEPLLGLSPEGGGAPPPGWGEHPAEALEVLGGPEDGRLLEAGAWICRWSPEQGEAEAGALYVGTSRFDPSLSRSPVLCLEPGGAARLDGARGAELLRARLPPWLSDDDVTDHGDEAPAVERLPPGGAVALRQGDVLSLTPLTRLRAR